jgi:hypothetical protein
MSSTSWSSMSGRSISFTKRKAESMIRVIYTDTLGTYYSTTGNGCYYQLLVGSTVSGRVYQTYMTSTKALGFVHVAGCTD